MELIGSQENNREFNRIVCLFVRLFVCNQVCVGRLLFVWGGCFRFCFCFLFVFFYFVYSFNLFSIAIIIIRMVVIKLLQLLLLLLQVVVVVVMMIIIIVMLLENPYYSLRPQTADCTFLTWKNMGINELYICILTVQTAGAVFCVTSHRLL